MSSRAYSAWIGKRRTQLEQLFAAHAAVGGSGPGRRFSTEQLNHACIVALSGQFQGFARELLHEGVAALLDAVAPVDLGSPRSQERRLALQIALTQSLELDRKNPTEPTLVNDFKRLGIPSLKDAVRSTRVDGKRVRRKALWRTLDQMNTWRNAIAHQDFRFNKQKLESLNGVASPRMREVKRCHKACHQLAELMDVAVGNYLTAVAGSAPW